MFFYRFFTFIFIQKFNKNNFIFREKAEQRQKESMETELKLIKSFNEYSFKYEQLEVNV